MKNTKVWSLLDYVFMGFFFTLGILNVVTFLLKDTFTDNQLMTCIFNCSVCLIMIAICLSSIFNKTGIKCIVYFLGAFICIIKMGIIEEPDTFMRIITGILTMIFTMGGTLSLMLCALKKLKKEMTPNVEQPLIIKP